MSPTRGQTSVVCVIGPKASRLTLPVRHGKIAPPFALGARSETSTDRRASLAHILNSAASCLPWTNTGANVT